MKKISPIILLILTICSVSLAQNSSEEPLSFKVSLMKVLQSKKELLINSRLTNNSNEKLIVDKNLIGYGASFYTNNGFFTSSNEIGSEYNGQYLVILPKQSYKQVQVIKLDNDFFRINGEYIVKLNYTQYLEQIFEGNNVWRGMIESNEIIFHIKNGKISR